jgi:hypothetical protein
MFSTTNGAKFSGRPYEGANQLPKYGRATQPGLAIVSIYAYLVVSRIVYGDNLLDACYLCGFLCNSLDVASRDKTVD